MSESSLKAPGNRRSSASVFVCDRCGKSYKRREHLIRHVQSLNQRSFQCDDCGHKFTRSDTLKRHVATHCSKQHHRSSTRRAVTACDSCAGAKLRCSTGFPCNRCKRLGIVCNYRNLNPLACSHDAGNSSLQDGIKDQAEISGPLELAGEKPAEKSSEASPLLLNDLNEAPSYNEQTNDINSDDLFISSSWDHGTDSYQGLCLDYFDLGQFVSLSPFDSETNNAHIAGQRDNTSAIREDNITHGQPIENCPPADVPRYHQVLRLLEPETSAERLSSHVSAHMIQPSFWASSRSSSPTREISGDAFRTCISSLSHAEGANPVTHLEEEDILQMDDYAHVAKVSLEQVEQLAALIDYEERNSRILQGFDVGIFHNTEVMNVFVQLYFEHFHPNFPLLHKATFNVEKTPPIVVLAAAAIGSRYSRLKDARKHAYVLGEVLRKTLASLIEYDTPRSIQLCYAQAVVLSQIHLAYSGRRTLILKAQFNRNLLVTVCKGISASIRCKEIQPKSWSNTGGTDFHVRQWVNQELKRRLVYCGWLVDCQASLHFGTPPVMNVQDLEPHLPCSDILWDMDINQLSRSLENLHSIPRSLHLKQCLHFLRQQKDVLSGTGQFQNTIIMAAIYHQYQAVMQVTESLYHNITQQHETDEPPGFNTSPDAMHNIHWRETTTKMLHAMCPEIGRSSHTNADGVVKLFHYISIVICVPMTQLCAFAGWMTNEEGRSIARKRIVTWIRNDGESAQKALLHAANLFSLIRQQWSDAYFEGHSLLLAVLTIWAFSVLDAAPGTNGHSASSISADKQSSREQNKGQSNFNVHNIWLLDGDKFGVHIPGVGNICGPTGARRILTEGHRLLTRHGVWGISREFAFILENLISRGHAFNVR